MATARGSTAKSLRKVPAVGVEAATRGFGGRCDSLVLKTTPPTGTRYICTDQAADKASLVAEKAPKARRQDCASYSALQQ
jgi:hypothetical protein